MYMAGFLFRQVGGSIALSALSTVAKALDSMELL
jgi:hypothetical protein